jgi:hypothetical protein
VHHQWVAEQTDPRPRTLPRKLVFRIPMVALLGVLFLALCESWVTFSAPVLTVLYVIPIGIAWWLLRLRTTVDADTIVVRRVFSRRTLPWSAVSALRVRDRKWVAAVLADGTEVTLPTVRTRHMSALAVVTGRIEDPLGSTRPADADEPATAPDTGTDSAPADEPATGLDNAPAAADAPTGDRSAVDH